jgi:hypothetical protein
MDMEFKNTETLRTWSLKILMGLESPYFEKNMQLINPEHRRTMDLEKRKSNYMAFRNTEPCES